MRGWGLGGPAGQRTLERHFAAHASLALPRPCTSMRRQPSVGLAGRATEIRGPWGQDPAIGVEISIFSPSFTLLSPQSSKMRFHCGKILVEEKAGTDPAHWGIRRHSKTLECLQTPAPATSHGLRLDIAQKPHNEPRSASGHRVEIMQIYGSRTAIVLSLSPEPLRQIPTQRTSKIFPHRNLILWYNAPKQRCQASQRTRILRAE